MEQLSLGLIREAHASSRPSENVLRAVTNATNTLCQWAADPTVPESVAAPCVTEAVRKVTEIADRAQKMRAPVITKETQRALMEALDVLNSFLSDEDEEFEEEEEQENTRGEVYGLRPYGKRLRASVPAASTSANALLPAADVSGKGGAPRSHVRANASILRRSMPEKEIEKVSFRGCKYMRLLICGVWAITVVFIVLLAAIAMGSFANAEEARQEAYLSDLLTIALEALDALHPALIEEDVDIKHTGIQVAAELLVELSTTYAIGKYTDHQMMFFNPRNKLYEFRAGQQIFESQNSRVTSVVTPRHYRSLCRQNKSYPFAPLNDAGWLVKALVTPQLTPGQCENDAGLQGVFVSVTPPYQRYSRYVKTYRRNAGRLMNYYNANFGLSVAVTEDWLSMQNLFVPRSTLFGAQMPFSFISDTTMEWKGQLFLRLGFVVGICLGVALLVGQVFTLPQLQFYGHRLVFASALALIALAALVVAAVFTQNMINAAAEMELLQRTENVARCLASGFTSATLAAHGNARNEFIRRVVTGPLHHRVFYLSNNKPVAEPSSMQPVADAIGVEDIIAYNRGQVSGSAGGYVYADFAQPRDSRHAVVVNERSQYTVPVKVLPAVVVFGIVAVWLYSLLLLYGSPLRRIPLPFASGSALLIYWMSPRSVRRLLYIVVPVLMVGSMIGMNSYGSLLLKEVMKEQAKDSLQILGATLRSRSVIDTCDSSCGLPSFLVGLSFTRSENNSAVYIPTSNPLPYSNSVDWTNRYLGAQLVMGQLPIVLEAAPSFSTPLVNETTGVIRANRILRVMSMSVDVNDSFGITIERLSAPYGEAGTHFTFVAHSIGLCLVGAAMCLFFPILEWAYTQLLLTDPRNHRPLSLAPPMLSEGCCCCCRRRCGRRVAYTVFVLFSSLFMASLLLINAGVLRAKMHESLELFVESELSMTLTSFIERLETVALGEALCLTEEGADCDGQRQFERFQQQRRQRRSAAASPVTANGEGGGDDPSHHAPLAVDGDEEKALWNLAVAVAHMEDSVTSSISPYAQWVLLQEYPSYGSNRVRMITGPQDLEQDGDPAYAPETHFFGSLNFGAVPVCGTANGIKISPKPTRTKRFCFVEIPGNSLSDLDLPPRIFLMLLREDAAVITGPADRVWKAFMFVSVSTFVAVLLFLLLFTWFFLLSSRHWAFATFVSDELLSMRSPIPWSFQSIDMYIPRRYRIQWVVILVLGTLTALLYFAATSQILFQPLREVSYMLIPSVTQERALQSITNGVLMDGYNYVLVSQSKSLSSIQSTQHAIQGGTVDYEFVFPQCRRDLGDTVAQLHSALSLSTTADSSQTADLITEGWDTYQTYLAGMYETNVKQQELVHALCDRLYESLNMYFTSDYANDNEEDIVNDAEFRVQFVQLLDAVRDLRDELQQLFIFEHVAVASYLVFTSSSTLIAEDENAFWPFGNADGIADEKAGLVLAVATQMLLNIAATISTFEEHSKSLFRQSPSLLIVAEESVAGIYEVLPTASALYSAVLRANLDGAASSYLSTTSTGSAESQSIWDAQRGRAKEVNYVSNYTQQAQKAAQTAEALASVAAASEQSGEPVGYEIRSRKSSQLYENLARGVPLDTLKNLLRWQCFKKVDRVEKDFLTTFVCTCVFYSMWVIGCALCFAETRERVGWWLATSTSVGGALGATLGTGRRSTGGGGSVEAEESALVGSSAEFHDEDADRDGLAALDHDAKGKDGHTSGSPHGCGAGVEESYAEGDEGLKDSGNLSSYGNGDSAAATAAATGYDSTRRRSSLVLEQRLWTGVLRQYRHHNVLSIVLVLCGLALAPVGIAYWLNGKGVSQNKDADGAVAMGLRTVLYQLELQESCQELLYKSAQSYTHEDLLSLRRITDNIADQAVRLAQAYVWRLQGDRSARDVDFGGTDLRASSHPGASPQARMSNTELSDFLELANTIKAVIAYELELFQSQVADKDLEDLSVGLSGYARFIIDSVTVSDDDTKVYSYDDVMPLSLSTGSSAVRAYAEALSEDAAAAAEAAASVEDLGAVVSEYASRLLSLEQVTEAQLNVWHVAVLGARNNGGVFAVNHGATKLNDLIGSDALDAMDDGSALGSAAVAEIQAYFADVLATLGGGDDAEAVMTLFSESDLGDMPDGDAPEGQCLDGAVRAAAVSASYLSSIVTELDFKHFFAFHRGIVDSASQSSKGYMDSEDRDNLRALLPASRSLKSIEASFEEEPLVNLVSDFIASSKELMQKGVTGVEGFSERGATMNQWIWNKEVYMVPEDNGAYSSLDYVNQLVLWSTVCAMWLAGIAFIYAAFAMELVS